MSRGNLIIVVITLFSMFPTPACSSGTSASAVNSPLIGVWEKGYTFGFFDNGTYAVNFPTSRGWYGGRYSIYDNVLMPVTINNGREDHNSYTFIVSGNTLTLSSDHYSGIYKRVKLLLK